MNDRIASYLDEIFDWVNQYNSLCMTHLLWDPMVKTTWGWILLQGTAYNFLVSSVGRYLLSHFFFLLLSICTTSRCLFSSNCFLFLLFSVFYLVHNHTFHKRTFHATKFGNYQNFFLFIFLMVQLSANEKPLFKWSSIEVLFDLCTQQKTSFANFFANS